MKSPAIIILTAVAVFGSAGAAMAVNSGGDLLSGLRSFENLNDSCRTGFRVGPDLFESDNGVGSDGQRISRGNTDRFPAL